MTEKHPDLPTPKFKIGDIVFAPSIDRRIMKLDCPDCDNTRLWTVTTPAGHTLEAACLRCTAQLQNLPPLTYQEAFGSVQQMVIGSIQINTDAGPSNWNEEPVAYMCRETGIGSGTLWRESRLHETSEAAQVAADAQAAKANAEKRDLPEAIKQRHFSHLTLTDALYKSHQSDIWGAWYVYHDLREKIDGYLKGEMSKDDLTYEMHFEDNYRREPDRIPIFDQILFAIEDGHLERAREAMAKLPFKIRRKSEEDHDNAVV